MTYHRIDRSLVLAGEAYEPALVRWAKSFLSFFLEQALKCRAERGMTPNGVAGVDRYIGDVLAVVEALNGIEADAQER